MSKLSCNTRAPRLLSSFPLAAALLLGPIVAQAQGTGYWHTAGNRILDSNNQAVRIAGINWYGFETTRGVPGGLTSQDYKAVLQTIKSQGYNTVRIPLSNQMVETPQVPSSISFSNGINSDLQNLNALGILDKVVTQAGALNLKVILDNHRSEAGDSAESNGLWYTGQYPESAWINDWTGLAQRYAGNPTVIGFDLRNEPHNATSGGSCWDCGGANDWHLAAARAGNAVLSVNPKLLIFVEGTDAYNNDWTWWGGNLEGVRNSPVTLNVANQLVYSPHEYGPREYGQSWFNGNPPTPRSSPPGPVTGPLSPRTTSLPSGSASSAPPNNPSDIQNNAAGSQGQYFQSLVQYLGSDATLNWTYWAVNGEDAYGLLDTNYSSSPASNLKQQSLSSIQFQFGAGANSGGGGTTTPPPSNSPAAPTNVTALAASTSQINLAWQASTSAGATYNVYGSTTAGFAPSSSTFVASGITSTSYAATGLSASTTYFYIVQAVLNGYGSDTTGRASATTSATSTPPPSTPPPTGGGSASSGYCHVTYTVSNDWGSGMTGAVSITNTGGSPIAHWTVTWAFGGNQQLSQSWNGSYTQSGSVVSITDAGYNGNIAAGATQSRYRLQRQLHRQQPRPVHLLPQRPALQLAPDFHQGGSASERSRLFSVLLSEVPCSPLSDAPIRCHPERSGRIPAFAFACPFGCRSGAKRRNLLLPLQVLCRHPERSEGTLSLRGPCSCLRRCSYSFHR